MNNVSLINERKYVHQIKLKLAHDNTKKIQSLLLLVLKYKFFGFFQHDPENNKACVPGGEDGNYIMFARAILGDKSNIM